MSVDISEFSSFFEAVYERPPFPWQIRLANQVFNKGWPDCIDLPTASGKTSAIDIAVFVLACQAGVATKDRKVGRRIFFAVNRRVIVDEAHERAFDLASKLLKAKEGVVNRVADALRSINADKDAPPLDVAELRGGIYRDRRWARGITQPIVVATTADQLGSRLLFRGYGVSPAMQPIHAALTACDSLILLDEAHVTRAFAQTLHAISKYRQLEPDCPPMRFVQMTATPAGDSKVERFGLDQADHENTVLAARRNASKPAELVNLGKAKGDKYIAAIVERALNSLSDERKAIAVIVNRVQTARDVYAAIRERLKDEVSADVHLVIGRMRPIDRDELTAKLRKVVGPDRGDAILPKACFVVATQCLEVGADYDFDALVTECASIDALRQRFGRLNRRGRPLPDGRPFPTRGTIVTSDTAMKEDDPVYGPALRNTWNWLTDNGRQAVDFGIREFELLWKAIEGEADKYLDSRKPTTILAPAPDAAVLLPAHLDALCQTAPLAVPSPDVSYFIHGPQRDSAEVQVCWRADLGDEWTKWAEIVRLLPPTSLECMTVPLTTVRKWLVNEPDPASADAAAQMIDEGVETHLPENDSIGGRMVLIWRGQESEPADDPRDLKPGDTIVIPTQQYGWEAFGHIPDAPTAADTKSATIEQRPAFLERRDAVDCAEYAMASGKRRVVVRIHSVFTPPALLLNHALAPEGTLSRDEIRDELHPLFETIVRNVLQRRPSLDEESKRRLATAVEQVRRGAFDPHIYPKSQHGRAGLVIIFRKLLPNPSDLPQISSSEEENGEPLPDAVVPVRLEDHTRHVVDRLIACLDIEKESLGVDKATFVRAAELHDIGKADIRFQALLLGATPQEAMERPTLLAKSGNSILTRQEAADARQRSKLPDRFRHEMLSVGIIKNALVVLDPSADHDLLVHLIAAHHGYARPLAPVVIDEKEDTETNAAFAERLELKRTLNHGDIDGNRRLRWVPAHHFDSGIAERFWMLIRRAEIGWWGLAYRESILRIADQQASEAEQNQKEPK